VAGNLDPVLGPASLATGSGPGPRLLATGSGPGPCLLATGSGPGPCYGRRLDTNHLLTSTTSPRTDVVDSTRVSGTCQVFVTKRILSVSLSCLSLLLLGFRESTLYPFRHVSYRFCNYQQQPNSTIVLNNFGTCTTTTKKHFVSSFGSFLVTNAVVTWRCSILPPHARLLQTSKPSTTTTKT
jgi:hypothetical protein